MQAFRAKYVFLVTLKHRLMATQLRLQIFETNSKQLLLDEVSVIIRNNQGGGKCLASTNNTYRDPHYSGGSQKPNLMIVLLTLFLVN